MSSERNQRERVIQRAENGEYIVFVLWKHFRNEKSNGSDLEFENRLRVWKVALKLRTSK